MRYEKKVQKQVSITIINIIIDIRLQVETLKDRPYKADYNQFDKGDKDLSTDFEFDRNNSQSKEPHHNREGIKIFVRNLDRQCKMQAGQ